MLDRIASERGLPEAIVPDNGPEFRGRAMAAWSEERGVRLESIWLWSLFRALRFQGKLKPRRLYGSTTRVRKHSPIRTLIYHSTS